MQLPYTTHEAAKLFDQTHQGVLHKIWDGRLKAHKQGRDWFLDRGYIDDLVARGLKEDPELLEQRKTETAAA